MNARLARRVAMATAVTVLTLLGLHAGMELPGGVDSLVAARTLPAFCIAFTLGALAAALTPLRRSPHPLQPERPPCAICAAQPGFRLRDAA